MASSPAYEEVHLDDQHSKFRPCWTPVDSEAVTLLRISKFEKALKQGSDSCAAIPRPPSHLPGHLVCSGTEQSWCHH